MSGKPDIAIKKYKIAIFLDSCFWHGCELHYSAPETRREYWQTKIMKNKIRDLKITNYYVNHGWHILRIWEHELKDDFDGTIQKIIEFINRFRTP